MYLGGSFVGFSARRPKTGIELECSCVGTCKTAFAGRATFVPVWPELVKQPTLTSCSAIDLEVLAAFRASFAICAKIKTGTEITVVIGWCRGTEKEPLCVSFFENVEFACKFSLLLRRR